MRRGFQRNELNARMDEALSVYKDPWKEVVENEKTKNELFNVVTS
ncbi:hypothetical protein KP78_08020 [Jeotgalibacillus soli]|uniref:Uncharacterized protein n=1 Tax=Jeotgalibacillus soli TaxID=889306 RepID=A0A0C2S5K9_9BACL|nr:hypothetical protein KP78_08020 [Jeotgalibacillus soli]